MKNIFLIAALLFTSITASNAQILMTKNGKITFFSKTSMENISAVNNQVVSVMNTKTGSIQFSVQINGFLFKKALMQEHFNEEYMQSDKFPKAIFKGTITDLSKINFTKDGDYNITVAGDLTIHGASNKVSAPGVISIKGGKLNATSTFNVLLADYKIDVPSSVVNNISKTIEIKVDCDYSPK